MEDIKAENVNIRNKPAVTEKSADDDAVPKNMEEINAEEKDLPKKKGVDVFGSFIDKSLGGMREWFAKRKSQRMTTDDSKNLKIQVKNKVVTAEESQENAKKTDFISQFELDPEQIARLTDDEKKQILEAEKLFQEGVASIRDLIAPSYVEVNLSYMRIGDQYVRSFYVYSYPRYIESNWLSPIINYEAIVDIAQFVYPIDSGQIMRTLRRKVTQMSAAVHMNQAKGIISDPGLETALEDAEELRIRLQRGEEKFFQFALYFTVYADSLEKLDRVSKRLESLLGGKLILSKRADFQAEHAFNATLPICLDELDVVRNMNTSPLSSTFPFSSSTLSSNEGVLFGLNRHNDSLIIFDRFSLENANSVIFAKSGAGKSYAVKLEVLRSLMMGTDVIIIDPENEYESLSEVVGGSYMKVSLNSDRRINPFDLPVGLKDETLKPGDLLRTNIISLHGLLKLMLGDSTAQEEALLDKALIDTYAIKGMTMDKITYEGDVPPTMQDLHDVLTGMDGADNIATKLDKFTTGTFAGIFNKSSNVDLSSGLVVFSIRDLEDSLRPIAMYIILNYIWNRVRSSLRKRILVIDEAWSLMQHDDSAEFLFGLVKRARKYWLGICTITQDVEDFMKSSFGKPIITNSSMQLLLKQSPSALEPLSKAFNLTEGEKYMLINSAVGQGLFFAGNQHAAIQIIASFTEDKIVTTNPEEIALAEASVADFGIGEQLPTLKEEEAVERELIQGASAVVPEEEGEISINNDAVLPTEEEKKKVEEEVASDNISADVPISAAENADVPISENENTDVPIAENKTIMNDDVKKS